MTVTEKRNKVHENTRLYTKKSDKPDMIDTVTSGHSPDVLRKLKITLTEMILAKHIESRTGAIGSIDG